MWELYKTMLGHVLAHAETETISAEAYGVVCPKLLAPCPLASGRSAHVILAFPETLHLGIASEDPPEPPDFLTIGVEEFRG